MNPSFALALCLLAAQPGDSAAEKPNDFEQNFGGRHWADAPLDPPKSPQAALATFRLPPGLAIELVAAEPLVIDPVAVAFDDLGRMYVVEYRDYPTGPAEGQPPLSRIRLLEDTDGDGRMDESHVFADRLTFAHSLMPFYGGILTTAQSEIVFLKDTDGDHRADVRRVLFRGFKADHPQRQIGNPRWGIDNWIYLNFGVGKVAAADSPDSAVSMPRLDFRFHPLSMKFEPDGGLGQYGNTIDNWGNRFFCANRNPIQQTVIPWSAARRNPFAVIAKTYGDVAPSAWQAKVFPIVEMKVNWLAHAGTHTAACGVTAYRGDLLPEQYSNNVFVCEPTGHLVTRSIVQTDGVRLKATRGRPKQDFLASTDTWFLPGSLATGPDGALYVADMYRAFAEHPRFLPDEVAQKLDLRAGDDRGRIYRIVPLDARPRKYAPPKTTAETVALLEDANGWRRHTAQRLLVERQSADAIEDLHRLLSRGDSAVARLHALWTLDGLGALNRRRIETALGDADSHVRKDAVALAALRLRHEPVLLDRLLALVDDNDARVRFQVALALGETEADRATQALIALAARDGHDGWFRMAILTSARERSAAILTGLVARREFIQQAAEDRIDLIGQLASVVGARGDERELTTLFQAIAAGESDSWWQTASLTGLAAGLRRHRGRLGRTNLSALLAKPPSSIEPHAAQVRQVLQRACDIAANGKFSPADRVAAVGLLSHLPREQAIAAFSELLGADQPVEVRRACIAALGTINDNRVATIVLRHWPSYTPALRSAALELCFRKVNTIQAVLQAMVDGKVEPSAAGLDQRLRAIRNRNPQIRSLALRLFGGAVSANRGEVLAKYKTAVSLRGDAAHGQAIFKKTCATCHKIDGFGHDVGPDISDVRGKPREILLNDILDPSRAVEPKYSDYSVVTVDGRVFNGLMVVETAETIILRRAESKQDVILRGDIDEIHTTGKSLMPEGVEKEVTVQQMADLLEFLKTRN